jgi:orotate phosphoribosyltransferase
MKSNHTLEIMLVNSPGVLNYNPNLYFEVQPGRKSPIFINIKNTLSNIKLRKIIVQGLLDILPPNIDFVCGVESGGSYYASIIADKLNKPLVLYRKNDKGYAESGRFVGSIPAKLDNVAVIDDVIVSGVTIKPAVHKLRSLGCQIKVIAILSYGHDSFIEKELSVSVCTVTDIHTFLSVALDQKILPAKDIDFLNNFVSQQRKKLFFQTTNAD